MTAYKESSEFGIAVQKVETLMNELGLRLESSGTITFTFNDSEKNRHEARLADLENGEDCQEFPRRFDSDRLICD